MLDVEVLRKPMLSSIANLLEDLHRNDIAYCTLKGNDQHLNRALDGDSDLDVLFRIEQKEQLTLILTSLGFKEFVAIRQKRFKDVYDFLTLDVESGKVIHLHTYFGFTIGEPFLKGYQPDIATHILATRVYNPAYGLYCIQPALELTLLYVTETLKLRRRDLLKKKLPLPEKAVCQHNWLRARTTPSEIDDAVMAVFKNQTRISSLFESEFSRPTLQRMASDVKKALAKDRLYSPVHGLWLRWAREVELKIRRILSLGFRLPVSTMRTNPRAGIIVSMIESRNAPKATLYQALKNTFGKKLDVYGINLQQKKAEATDAHAKQSITRGLTSLIDAWATLQKVNLIRAAKNTGLLVICHHSPHLENESSSYSGNLILKNLRRLESKLRSAITKSFSPDLVFEFNGAEDPITSDMPVVYPSDDRTSPEAVSNNPTIKMCRVVKVSAEKAEAEKLEILRREIWKEL